MHFLNGNAMMVVALPVVGLLVSVVFRVDEYAFTSSRKSAKPQGRQFANFDAEQNSMADPDGTVYRVRRKAAPQLLRDRVRAQADLRTAQPDPMESQANRG